MTIISNLMCEIVAYPVNMAIPLGNSVLNESLHLCFVIKFVKKHSSRF